MSARILDILRLGAQGDGIGDIDGRQVFLPFTAPGDRVSVALEATQATLISVLQAGPNRTKPPCPHFGPDSAQGGCGGCGVQHLALPLYEDWKRGLVVSALEARGLNAPVGALVTTAPGARRRVVFAARRTEAGVLMGFNRGSSHEIVPVTTCVVASARINRGLEMLRSLAAAVALGPQAFRFAVLDTASGFDLSVDAPFKVSDTDRLRIIETVRTTAGVARLAFNEEVLIEKNPPQISFGSVTVTPPPGGFVQASASAEHVMAGLVSDHLGKSKRVADLFSGCGTFAFRLAVRSAVHGVEADGGAISALDRAARTHPGLKPVTCEKRDLFRRPLMTAELKAFQGLVFDPPRAGAESQSKEIARSAVVRVAAVSCNPVTLARDLEILVKGGYRIVSVTPVDQFLWSPHVEAVALLTR